MSSNRRALIETTGAAPRSRSRVLWPALAALCLWALAPAAHASPISYTFTTGNQPVGAPLFASGTSVSGSFLYDSASAASGTHPNGSTIYAASITSLAGSVAGQAFSDPSGLTNVGDEATLPPTTCAASCDFFLVAGDPVSGGVTTPDDFVGFATGGLQLVNVRLLWIEGQLGAGDFLTNQNLPGVLPGFEGRLALDFVDPNNPSGPTTSVFFDGLFVQGAPVPEPTTTALLAAGLLALRAARAKRR